MAISNPRRQSKKRIRIVYLSRQFNRSGFYVLEALIRSPDCEVAGVVLPPIRPSLNRMARLDSVWLAPIERVAYRLECARQGAAPLRFEGSIRRLAKRSGINVTELPTLKNRSSWDYLGQAHPDLIVLGGGWPELLPPEVFALAPLGAINTHPSLLPEYRGTDVHRWQILNGVKISGTTIHYVDEDFDTGAIIGRRVVKIGPAETPQGLSQLTAETAGDLMVDVIKRLARAAPERVEGIKQPKQGRGTLPKWPWSNMDFLRINAEKSADELYRFVRASTQESFRYGGPWFSLGGTRFIIREATPVKVTAAAPPGTISEVGGHAVLTCGEGALILNRVQEYQSVPLRTRSIGGRKLVRLLLDCSQQLQINDCDVFP